MKKKCLLLHPWRLRRRKGRNGKSCLQIPDWHCNHSGSIFCNFVFNAHCTDHNELLYVLLGDFRELRLRICHQRQGRQGLHIGKGQLKIHTGYGFLQPVRNGAVQEPGVPLKFWNSVILVGPIVFFQLFVACLASYGFTRYRGRIREIIFSPTSY